LVARKAVRKKRPPFAKRAAQQGENSRVQQQGDNAGADEQDRSRSPIPCRRQHGAEAALDSLGHRLPHGAIITSNDNENGRARRAVSPSGQRRREMASTACHG
jgi:hypothetical protein